MRLKILFVVAVCAVLTSNIFAESLDLSAQANWDIPTDTSGNTDFSGGTNGMYLTTATNSHVSVSSDITAGSNSNAGVYAANGGKINISGSSSGLTLDVSGNVNYGLFADGTDSEININNMNVKANNSSNMNADGIGTSAGSKINFLGDGTNSLEASGVSNGYGILSLGQMTIKDMDITASNNRFGGIAGNVDIKGSTLNQNVLKAENNMYGLIASGSKMTIKDMDIQLNNNNIGIYSTYNSFIEISGSTESVKSLEINNSLNAGMSIEASTMIIKGMNINISSSAQSGIVAYNSTLEITGNNIADQINIKNNQGVAIYAIGETASITIKDMNIEAGYSASGSGIGADGGAKFKISGGTGSAKNLFANNNSNGIVTGGSSTIIIDNMNIEASNNRDNGIYAVNYGAIKILSGNNTAAIKANNNTGSGIGAASGGKVEIFSGSGVNSIEADSNKRYGITSMGPGSVVGIYGMDVSASSNVFHGVYTDDGGKIEMQGDALSNNILQVNNSVQNGIYSEGSGSVITIKDMDIYANNNLNASAISADTGGLIEIVGGSNANKIEAAGNGVAGISASRNASVSITNMEINTSSESIHGINAGTGGKVNITGGAENNKLNTSYNAQMGIGASGSNTKITIEDMDVTAAGNKYYGVYTSGAAEIEITGSANLVNKLEISGSNANAGSAGLMSTGSGSNININNMDIKLDNNKYGIFAAGSGKININSSENNTNSLNITNTNSTAGLLSNNNNSEINITNMNITIDSSMSGASPGMKATDNGKINITGDAAKSNSLNVSGHNNGISAESSSSITIKDMHVYANNSRNYATPSINISATGSATINISASNPVSAKNLVANQGSTGLYSTGSGSLINVSNMDVTVDSNTNSGITAMNSGSIKITGSDLIAKKLTASGNKNGLNSSSGYSLITISKMDVDISNNNESNLYIQPGGMVNISGSKTLSNKFSANNSITGYGLSVSGAGSFFGLTEINSDISGNYKDNI